MDRNYKVIFNIDTGVVTIPDAISTFNTDKNIFKINVELIKIEKDKVITIKNKELKDYKIELFANKPSLKEWVSCIGEVDEKLDIINFDLPDCFSDIRGQYKCELRITDKSDRTLTSFPFTYQVLGSVTTNASKETKKIIQKVEPRVIDNLITTNGSLALSAKQGYELNNKIDKLAKELNDKINNINNDLK